MYGRPGASQGYSKAGSKSNSKSAIKNTLKDSLMQSSQAQAQVSVLDVDAGEDSSKQGKEIEIHFRAGDSAMGNSSATNAHQNFTTSEFFQSQ